MSGLRIIGTGGAGRKTAAAGTPITQLIPPRRGARSRLDNISVATLGTAHTLTAMQALGWTTLTAAVAAGANPLALAADPGPAGNGLAAGDFVVVEKPDGTFHVATVSGGTGVAPTLTGNVPTGGFNQGARVWNMGIPGDTVPMTGNSAPQFDLLASVTNAFSNVSGNGLCGGNLNYEPVLLHIDNVTAASTVRQVAWIYTEEGVVTPNPLMGEQEGGGMSGDEGHDMAELGPQQEQWGMHYPGAEELIECGLLPEPARHQEKKARPKHHRPATSAGGKGRH